MKKKIQQILLPTNGSLDLTVVRTVNMNEEMYLSVLIGLAEIERLPYDKNHVVFKILVGRFYNTGYKLNKLSQVFGVSEKTIRKWGKALELGDVEEMNRVFGGNTNEFNCLAGSSVNMADCVNFLKTICDLSDEEIKKSLMIIL